MPSKRKPEARKLREVSRQVMVAVPAWVRRRLGVEAGAVVYFHRHREGEVVLSPKPGRRAGTIGRHDLEEELAVVTAERDDWKRQALAQGSAQARVDYGQLVQQLFRQMYPIQRQLDQLAGLVRQLPGRVVLRRRPGRIPLPRGVVAIDLDVPDTGEEQAPRADNGAADVNESLPSGPPSSS